MQMSTNQSGKICHRQLMDENGPCLRSLANTRRHSIPDGSEQNEFIARIHPREIPSGGFVCYACYVAACRNVQRTTNVEEGQQNPGPSDIVAQIIYPIELPKHTHLCVDCWVHKQEYVQIAEGRAVQPEKPKPSISLVDDYKHTYTKF
ncbi:unnamed protein product [Parnassius apollo]|uniref:(apollo) hypothetical protein n=1 Tax=Parnassius apollo TaxID=110799 RepID=A0A8S3WGW2_PARAO|nr:unnamed protein product [Parnassius apollo]